MPPRLPHHPYRLFHLSARLRLHKHPPPNPSPNAQDDFYSLLLTSPLPTPAQKAIVPAPAPESPQSSPPATATSTSNSSRSFLSSSAGPNNDVLFSTPLAGPSARMRGLARAEKGMGRPPEPENCCMSGCVNCVWDAYREELEEWAAARRKGDEGRAVGRGGSAEGEEKGDGVGVGELDEPGGGREFEGVDLGDEGIFEGVPVGIREFMNVEKRLRERRAEKETG